MARKLPLSRKASKVMQQLDERFRIELLARYAGRSDLNEAIRYVLSGPGKLLRPKLVYASALTASIDEDCWLKALPAMLAVEMVHCYSLVHDDLPAMDNDDFRRGRPSCHKQFNEATAILVGDALIPDAFSVLTTAAENPLAQVRELAAAIGSSGMVLGQHFDLGSNSVLDFERWREIHRLKTGRLFECACVMGALSVSAPKEIENRIREFAQEFGLAFQLVDDLKDNDGTVALLGRDRVQQIAEETATRAKKLAESLQSEHLLAIASTFAFT